MRLADTRAREETGGQDQGGGSKGNRQDQAHISVGKKDRAFPNCDGMTRAGSRLVLFPLRRPCCLSRLSLGLRGAGTRGMCVLLLLLLALALAAAALMLGDARPSSVVPPHLAGDVEVPEGENKRRVRPRKTWRTHSLAGTPACAKP